MGQRLVRVNALLHREISSILRSRYTVEAVAITITGVDVAPDLRQSYVYYSVLGDEQQKEKAKRFFQKNAKEIRYQLGRTVTLKYLPFLKFVADKAVERGNTVSSLLDELNKDS